MEKDQPILSREETIELRNDIDRGVKNIVIPFIEARQVEGEGLTTRNDIKFR